MTYLFPKLSTLIRKPPEIRRNWAETSATIVAAHSLDLVVLLHVFPQLCQLGVLSRTLATGVGAGALVLLPMLVHVTVQLTLDAELITTLWADEVLFFLVQHDVGLEAGHAGKLLAAFRADGVAIFPNVGGQVKAQVVLHVEGRAALHASVTGAGQGGDWCHTESPLHQTYANSVTCLYPVCTRNRYTASQNYGLL